MADMKVQRFLHPNKSPQGDDEDFLAVDLQLPERYSPEVLAGAYKLQEYIIAGNNDGAKRNLKKNLEAYIMVREKCAPEFDRIKKDVDYIREVENNKIKNYHGDDLLGDGKKSLAASLPNCEI